MISPLVLVLSTSIRSHRREQSSHILPHQGIRFRKIRAMKSTDNLESVLIVSQTHKHLASPRPVCVIEGLLGCSQQVADHSGQSRQAFFAATCLTDFRATATITDTGNLVSSPANADIR